MYYVRKIGILSKTNQKYFKLCCIYLHILALVTCCAYQIVRVITSETEIRPVKLRDINEQKMTFVIAKVEYNFNDNKAFIPMQ